MKIVYVNNNSSDNKLYNTFLEVLNLDYNTYEVDDIDKLIIEDTIKLIDRVTTSKCKKKLGRIGVKKYTKLKEKEVKKLLKENLIEQNPEVVLKFYNENKVIIDMFKYEVCEALDISKWEFDNIKKKLKVSGKQVVNICSFPKECKKYDRRTIYEIKLYNKFSLHQNKIINK